MMALYFFLAFFLFVILVGIWHVYKPLPPDLDYQGKWVPLEKGDLRLLKDLTYCDENGQRICEHEIYDTIFSLIEKAEKYILIDAFLFNDFHPKDQDCHRDLAEELTEKLLARKRQVPSLKIDVITDPINELYGGMESEIFRHLRQGGINLIVTDLNRLPDSNPLYSALWRVFFGWMGNKKEGGFLPNLFGEEGQVTLRSYLYLPNFKANHRKVFLFDEGDRWTSVITSANPHGPSAAHSNLGVLVRGEKMARQIYETEKGVAEFSGQKLYQPEFHLKEVKRELPFQARVVTEKALERSVLGALSKTEEGEKVFLATFYLSYQPIISELIMACQRGVEIQVILDPNHDAFGYRKSGVPNRPVAWELRRRSEGKIELRWYNTHGEQFHSKFLLIDKKNAESLLWLGSSNFTRRNLNNLNLETDVEIRASGKSEIIREVEAFWERIWTNEEGIEYTLPYEDYKEERWIKRLRYHFQEKTGMASF